MSKSLSPLSCQNHEPRPSRVVWIVLETARRKAITSRLEALATPVPSHQITGRYTSRTLAAGITPGSSGGSDGSSGGGDAYGNGSGPWMFARLF